MTDARHSRSRHLERGETAAALEIEGELASGLAIEAIELCAAWFRSRHRTVERIVDLGSGPGVDTAWLAEGFPSATVVAADASEVMLTRAEARARRLGFIDRFETCVVDLDGDLAIAGACDLAWSAMAVHHAEDELATLRRIRGLLRPHGLMCLLERAEPIAIRTADELGRPGLWERIDEARSEWFERARPREAAALKAEHYPEMLSSAGLELIVSKTLADTVMAPRDPAMLRFLTAQLLATARNIADLADAADVKALAEIADAEDRWEGLAVTSSRRLFVAQPAGAAR